MPMQACTCMHTHSHTQFEDGNKDQSQSHRYSSGMERHGVQLLVCSKERRTFFIHWQLLSMRHCHVLGPPLSLLKCDGSWTTDGRSILNDSQGSVVFRKTSIEIGFSLVLPPGLWVHLLPVCWTLSRRYRTFRVVIKNRSSHRRFCESHLLPNVCSAGPSTLLPPVLLLEHWVAPRQLPHSVVTVIKLWFLGAAPAMVSANVFIVLSWVLLFQYWLGLL